MQTSSYTCDIKSGDDVYTAIYRLCCKHFLVEIDKAKGAALASALFARDRYHSSESEVAERHLVVHLVKLHLGLKSWLHVDNGHAFSK